VVRRFPCSRVSHTPRNVPFDLPIAWRIPTGKLAQRMTTGPRWTVHSDQDLHMIEAITHIPNLIRPDQRNDDTIFVPSLTFVRRKDLDFRQGGKPSCEELDLLSIRSDDRYIFLFDPTGCVGGGKLHVSGVFDSLNA
jgi:hypothetical protein